jgi:RNA polymerase sigma factor (sigma-70 family)
VEGYTLRQQPLTAARRGPSPLLRLASDERLIELTRAGQQAAFETLVARYHARLLAFCRHMLRSREDAEDVLQEVFAAAFNAIMADSRPINARPWLYRIARNRSLNHLRRSTTIGVDSMDTQFADAGQSTSEKAHKREEFRLLLDDIGRLPETQRSALVLREMDALSYEQIAEAMDTTVPSVKSLLVRARIGLAEAAEARKLTCAEVRLELGAAAEGVAAVSAPARRHVKDCERCRGFRAHLRANNRALAAIFPLGPMLIMKKTLLAKLGLAKIGAGGAGAAAAGGTGGGVAVSGAAAAAGGGLGSVAAGAVVVKAVAVAATVAIVAVGASKALDHRALPAPTPAASAQAATAAQVHANPALAPPPILAVAHRRTLSAGVRRHHYGPVLVPVLSPAASIPAGSDVAGSTVTAAGGAAPSTPVGATSAPPPPAPTPTTQEISTTTVFPAGAATGATGATAPAGATGATGSTGTATGATGDATGSSSTPSFSQIETGTTGATGS